MGEGIIFRQYLQRFVAAGNSFQPLLDDATRYGGLYAQALAPTTDVLPDATWTTVAHFKGAATVAYTPRPLCHMRIVPYTKAARLSYLTADSTPLRIWRDGVVASVLYYLKDRHHSLVCWVPLCEPVAMTAVGEGPWSLSYLQERGIMQYAFEADEWQC